MLLCLQELGVTDNPNYKITFMLDSAAMITVHTPKRGVVEVGPYKMFQTEITSVNVFH